MYIGRRLAAAMIGLAILAGCGAPKVQDSVAPPANPTRVVSMAPSTTEILFAVGAGDSVVGVTRYCYYPEEAQTRAFVGGFIDPNYEAIVGLKPDLVVVYAVQDEAQQRLQALGIPALVVDHRTLEGIRDSILMIGEAVGRRAEAERLVDDADTRAARIAQRTAGRDRPRVLISAGRIKGQGTVTQVNAAGRNEWYDDLIQMAGGTNACGSDLVRFPNLSVEGIFALDPDVIVEMVGTEDQRRISEEEILAEWTALPKLKAVADGRVHIIAGDYAMIPGPRYVSILEALARILHPDVDWSAP